MVGLLAEHEVRWVLTGSAVLAVYGAELVPNDLDVTPALEADNLRKLADVLSEVSAIPAHVPDWPAGLTLEQCRAWRPYPASEANLDHLFVTSLGMLDVPPRVCGTYDQLLPQAATVDFAGVPVRVCDPREVLSRLDGRTRPKDLQRAATYQHMLSHNDNWEPIGVARLLHELG